MLLKSKLEDKSKLYIYDYLMLLANNNKKECIDLFIESNMGAQLGREVVY